MMIKMVMMAQEERHLVAVVPKKVEQNVIKNWGDVKGAAEKLQKELNDQQAQLQEELKHKANLLTVNDSKNLELILNYFGANGLLGEGWNNINLDEKIKRLQEFLESQGYKNIYIYSTKSPDSEELEKKPGFFGEGAINALINFAGQLEKIDTNFANQLLKAGYKVDTIVGLYDYYKNLNDNEKKKFLNYLTKNAKDLNQKTAGDIIGEFKVEPLVKLLVDTIDKDVAKYKELDAKRNDIEKRISELEKRISELEKRISELDESIEKLNNQDVKDRWSHVKNLLDSVKEDLDDVNSNMLNNANKNLEKAMYKSASEEYTNIIDKLDRIEENLGTVDININGLTQEMKSARESSKPSLLVIGKIQGRLEVLEKLANDDLLKSLFSDDELNTINQIKENDLKNANPQTINDLDQKTEQMLANALQEAHKRLNDLLGSLPDGNVKNILSTEVENIKPDLSQSNKTPKDIEDIMLNTYKPLYQILNAAVESWKAIEEVDGLIKEKKKGHEQDFEVIEKSLTTQREVWKSRTIGNIYEKTDDGKLNMVVKFEDVRKNVNTLKSEVENKIAEVKEKEAGQQPGVTEEVEWKRADLNVVVPPINRQIGKHVETKILLNATGAATLSEILANLINITYSIVVEDTEEKKMYVVLPDTYIGPDAKDIKYAAELRFGKDKNNGDIIVYVKEEGGKKQLIDAKKAEEELSRRDKLLKKGKKEEAEKIKISEVKVGTFNYQQTQLPFLDKSELYISLNIENNEYEKYLRASRNSADLVRSVKKDGKTGTLIIGAAPHVGVGSEKEKYHIVDFSYIFLTIVEEKKQQPQEKKQ